MIVDHKRYDLFGKSLVQKVVLTPPFNFTFPIADNACFLYMLEGEMLLQSDEEQVNIAHRHSLFLNCVNSSKHVTTNSRGSVEILVINFHPDILKKIYDRELPSLLQPASKMISNKSSEVIDSDFLIQKYIEGMVFYFQNSALVDEEILTLKLKEIVLLLSKTRNARAIQLILSGVFSPTTYTFKQIIEANLFSQMSIDELAGHCNLSRSSFKREFAKVYKDTPGNYIKTKKLEKAAELLLISDERITNIALECGFNDLAGFTTSFHDMYNVTPTAYRVGQTNK